MKQTPSKAAQSGGKLALLIVVLIALGIISLDYWARPALAEQAAEWEWVDGGNQSETDAPIVPAMKLAGRGLSQISPRPTSTFTPTPVAPTITPPPPTPTNTPAPPTNTPPPPTNTPAPPTNTPPPPTNTPPPPTPTNTPLPLPPQLGPISLANPLASVGVQIEFSAAFTEPLPVAINLIAWHWGDGDASTCPPNTTACSVSFEGSGGTVEGRHTYLEPGVYEVQLTMVDIYNQSDTTSSTIVIYDATAGFVTGAGWIDSLAGAYKPDPNLSGRAAFAFYSKYKKGTSAPMGNTNFFFKAGDLHFHSDHYQWLVINQGGENAQFKGWGTINGSSSPTGELYSFMTWARDGDPDSFRIKISYETPSGDVIVYDNGLHQPIAGGSIVVHKGK